MRVRSAAWALMLIILLASCGSRGGPLQVLESTDWVSDRATTLHWIAIHRPNLVGNAHLASLFGTMTIRFGDASVVTCMDTTTVVHHHQIIGQTEREIAFINYDALQKRNVIITLELDADRGGYWIYNSQFDIREHFVRAHLGRA